MNVTSQTAVFRSAAAASLMRTAVHVPTNNTRRVTARDQKVTVTFSSLKSRARHSANLGHRSDLNVTLRTPYVFRAIFVKKKKLNAWLKCDTMQILYLHDRIKRVMQNNSI